MGRSGRTTVRSSRHLVTSAVRRLDERVGDSIFREARMPQSASEVEAAKALPRSPVRPSDRAIHADASEGERLPGGEAAPEDGRQDEGNRSGPPSRERGETMRPTSPGLRVPGGSHRPAIASAPRGPSGPPVSRIRLARRRFERGRCTWRRGARPSGPPSTHSPQLIVRRFVRRWFCGAVSNEPRAGVSWAASRVVGRLKDRTRRPSLGAAYPSFAARG